MWTDNRNFNLLSKDHRRLAQERWPKIPGRSVLEPFETFLGPAFHLCVSGYLSTYPADRVLLRSPQCLLYLPISKPSLEISSPSPLLLPRLPDHRNSPLLSPRVLSE